MKRRIILHGHLAEKYPHDIEVHAETVAEAVSALTQISELQPLDGKAPLVRIDGIETDVALYSLTDMQEIHIRPFEGGAGGRGGLGQILLGVVMIAVGIINPAFLGAGMLANLGITAGSLILTGGLMVLGGILQMLTPMPTVNSPNQGSDESSRILGAGQNTVTIGTNIPLAYGIVKMGGHYLSFDVDASQQSKMGSVLGEIMDSFPMLENMGPTSNQTIVVGPNVYSVYDKPAVEIPVLLPIYTSQTTGPGNIPTSGWSG